MCLFFRQIDDGSIDDQRLRAALWIRCEYMECKFGIGRKTRNRKVGFPIVNRWQIWIELRLRMRGMMMMDAASECGIIRVSGPIHRIQSRCFINFKKEILFKSSRRSSPTGDEIRGERLVPNGTIVDCFRWTWNRWPYNLFHVNEFQSQSSTKIY